jgi:multidrug resistance efflux pump
MSEIGRIGTVELIIKVLTEHEHTFDSLLAHLDSSIDRIDIQRIEAKLKTEKEENENITVLVSRIADLEKQIEKYQSKIHQLEVETLTVRRKSLVKQGEKV